jgi:type I restriction enzyme S subunit
MNEIINIPNGWTTTTLGEIIDIKHGFAFKGEFISEIKNDYILVTPGNFYIGGGFKKEKFKYYNGDFPLEFIMDVNDIIITMTDLSKDGDTLGYAAKVPDDNLKYLHNQRIGLVKFKNDEYSKDFIYWLLRTPHYQKCIVNSATGSTVRHTSPKRIQQYAFSIPKDFNEQESIAKILNAFDEKIELLQNQNKTLEQLSQTIFIEWFGKYKVDDSLPEGWSVLQLDDLLELIIDYRGKTPLKLGMEWSEKGIPAISAKSIKNGKIVRRDAMNYGSENLYNIWMKDELKKGDILLTSEAPLGEMYYLNDDTKYILSQRVFGLRVNNKITSEYLYHYLYSINGQTLLKARASGSTVEGIRQSELRKIEIIVPHKDILDKSTGIFKYVFDKSFANEQQIQSLIKSRDYLIPKLISGEIKVINSKS